MRILILGHTVRIHSEISPGWHRAFYPSLGYTCTGPKTRPTDSANCFFEALFTKRFIGAIVIFCLTETIFQIQSLFGKNEAPPLQAWKGLS